MLFGRQSERRALDTLLAGARVADSGVLVLLGEPGIGKTALLDEAAAHAGDMQVLRAEGVESERLVPFAGLLQLLRPLLPLLDEIPEPQARALGSAFMLEPAGNQPRSRFAVGAATLSLLSRAAEDRPVAALVDDGHLLDQPTVEALTFAARRLVSDAVAVVAAVRAGAPGSDAWSALPSLTVDGVDLSAASQLVSSVSGAPVPDAWLTRLHAATSGNPLALLELAGEVERLASLPSDAVLTVSEELVRSFIGRAGELSTDARTALLVAAADSRSALTVRKACEGLDTDGISLSEAEDAGLLVVRGDSIEFRHPLVRSAVYGAAETGARRAVHRALASVIDADEVDRLTWHLSEGAEGPSESTAGLLEAVGRSAMARGAHGIATQAYRRASELTLDPDCLAPRLVCAAQAAWLAGTAPEALELLDQALSCHPPPQVRCRIHELRGAIEARCGSLEAALATLLQGAEDVARHDRDAAVRLLSDAVHVCFYLGDPARAGAAADTIEAMLSGVEEDRTRFLGRLASGMAGVLSGSGDAGVQGIRRALALLPALEEPEADQLRLPQRLVAGLWLRESSPARSLLGGAVDRLREKAALGALPYLLMHIARDDATTDRWQEAEASYLEAIQLATETGQSTDLATSLAGCIWLRARQGRSEECRQELPRALELSRTKHIHIATVWLDFAQGDLADGLGDTAEATRHYERLETRLATMGLSDPDLSPAPELVEIYLRLSRPEDATRLAHQFATRAVEKGQPWSRARAHRALAMCADGESVEASFGAALDLHDQTADRYETARTQLAFGACLRRRRRRLDARAPLRAAAATFEDLGAGPWADKATRELEATGEKVRRREAMASESLTPQELQVAHLLTGGLTTREAAAALFLSPKTVEYHLRHVYSKLGVRSRDALSTALARPADEEALPPPIGPRA